VGPATFERLRRLGVVTIGDLAALPEAALVGALGTAAGRQLHQLARGIDERPVVSDRPAKSVGHEQTFAHDLHDPDALAVEAVRMADAVASRLREHGLAGRTVTLKVRFGTFVTITRSTTLPEAVDVGPAIAAAARSLLSGVDPSPGVRLLGVSVSNLGPPAAHQLRLDELTGAGGGWDPATRAVDDVRRRFGPDAIGPASLVDGGRLRRTHRGERQWGPGGPASSEPPEP
jgi:DNA polymerase IV